MTKLEKTITCPHCIYQIPITDMADINYARVWQHFFEEHPKILWKAERELKRN